MHILVCILAADRKNAQCQVEMLIAQKSRVGEEASNSFEIRVLVLNEGISLPS